MRPVYRYAIVAAAFAAFAATQVVLALSYEPPMKTSGRIPNVPVLLAMAGLVSGVLALAVLTGVLATRRPSLAILGFVVVTFLAAPAAAFSMIGLRSEGARCSTMGLLSPEPCEDPMLLLLATSADTCPGVVGRDVEWNVASTLWDLYDTHSDGYDANGYGSDVANPRTNSIWKVMSGGTYPQSLDEFRAKWRGMNYDATMFDKAALQNRITY